MTADSDAFDALAAASLSDITEAITATEVFAGEDCNCGCTGRSHIGIVFVDNVGDVGTLERGRYQGDGVDVFLWRASPAGVLLDVHAARELLAWLQVQVGE